MITKWDYEGDFLEQFAQPRRSLIVNMFCNAVRSGSETVSEVIEAVKEDCRARFVAATCGGYESEAISVRDSMDVLNKNLPIAEARKFAEFILERENLPFEEKTRLKQARDKIASQNFMAFQPPTEKQISYLRYLGCKTEPQTKLEASNLISELKSTAA